MFHAVSTHSLGSSSTKWGPCEAASEEGWEMSWRGCEAAAQSLPIALAAHCLSLKTALSPAPARTFSHPWSVKLLVWPGTCLAMPLLGHRSSRFVHRYLQQVLVSPVCQLCCLLFLKSDLVRTCFLVQFPWTGSWTWGLNPFAPQRGDLLGHDILHTSGSHAVGWGCGIWKDHKYRHKSFYREIHFISPVNCLSSSEIARLHSNRMFNSYRNCKLLLQVSLCHFIQQQLMRIPVALYSCLPLVLASFKF